MSAEATSAAGFLPAKLSLPNLRNAAASCRGCDLYRWATQTVFGEGAVRARFMFVGEQPGDQEDVAGHPFVGPAGKLLRTALREAAIDDRESYITNAVKHFKFVQRGKRRIHAKPKTIELRACKPWLEAEITVVRPRVIVALGASAALSLLGSSFRLTQHRGQLFESQRGLIAATVHPSSILRAPDDEGRHQAMRAFVADIKSISAALNA